MHGLYGITDTQLLADGRLLPYCEAALEGGMRILQYRDKSQDAQRRLDEASALQQLCFQYGAQLLINDDLALATQLGVGVHLGQEDGNLAQARQQLGAEAIIGATCHASLDLAKQAIAQQVSYIAFGRFFNSHTKPAAPTATPELLATARQQFNLPLVAIGGINLDNGGQLISQGADALAVVHALFAAASASEVEQRARAFCQLFA